MANTANGSALTTNFNVSPYYDDYDETKDYYRILYRPGYAVQARELTQMQSILQKQIDRFGKHVFKEGSIVVRPKIHEIQIDKNFQYVKIKNSNYDGDPVIVENYKGLTLTGTVTGLQAIVLDVGDGDENSSDTKTLFVCYNKFNSSDETIKTFAPNEVLSCAEPSVTVLGADKNPTGISSKYNIGEGTIFAKEHFVRFGQQSIVISRYTTTPTCRVGFRLLEEIVRYTEDSSLLDPALEASNYLAPGADRFRIRAVLTTVPISNTEEAPDFVELLTINEGVIIESNEKPDYNVIGDEIARRTFDESGDYVVRGLTVRVRENLDTGTNLGLLPAANGGNSKLLSIGVEPGVGYVKGYEIQKLVTQYVPIDKSFDKDFLNNQILTAQIGTYITANQYSGSPILDQGIKIRLLDKAQNRVSNPATVSGNTIGYARLLSVVYDNGTLGTSNGTVRMHLFDIQMNGSNSFASVKSIYNPGGTKSDLFADVLLTNSGIAVIKDASYSDLLYYTGKTAVNSVSDLSYYYRKTSNSSISAAGVVSVSVGAEETLPYGNNAILGTVDERDIVLSVDAAVNVDASILVSGTSGTTKITRAGGTNYFNSSFNVGDKITLGPNGPSGFYTIANISFDGLSMNVNSSLNATATANSIYRYYPLGGVIDLTTNGIYGARTAVVSSTNKVMTISLNENFPSITDCTVTFQAARNTGLQINKVLRDNRFVKINCGTQSSLSGPFNLGISDLYRIRYIRKDSSDFTSETQGTDVTSSFIISNGQADSFYNHASIKPTINLTSSDRLLVKLDYFYPDIGTAKGVGYFTINSYPLNDQVSSNTTIRTEDVPIFTSRTTGISYNLRSFLDFRPVKLNTAADSTSVSGATVNPGSTDLFKTDGTSLRIPQPGTRITYDLEYYIYRIDLIVMDKSGVIQIIRGIPSVNPITPKTPDGTMALASIIMAPYPTLSPEYGAKIKRPDISCVVTKLSNQRFTMKDIGALKDRIVNLEYYTSLSLLEKAAVDLKVVDKNGLDRFKNGIFVDSFNDWALADRDNLDFRITLDRLERAIRPAYTTQAFEYDIKSNTNTRVVGDLVTLPYSEKVLISQPSATSYTNIEQEVFRFVGQLYLDPSTDFWIDTVTAPPNVARQGLNLNNGIKLDTGTINLINDIKNLNFDLGTLLSKIDLGNIVLDQDLDLTGGNLPQPLSQINMSTQTSTTGKIYPRDMRNGGAVVNDVVGTFNGAYTEAIHKQIAGMLQAAGYKVSAKDYLGWVEVINSTTTSGLRVGSELFTSTDSATAALKGSSFSSSAVSATASGSAFAKLAAQGSSSATDSATVDLGTKLLDSSIQNYMRSRTIKINGKGLTSNTRLFVFFDGENMSSYVTPLTKQQYNSFPWAERTNINYQTPPDTVGRTVRVWDPVQEKYVDDWNWRADSSANRGDKLFSDENGEVYGALWIPSNKKFFVGKKEVVVTDSPTNSLTDYTCRATSFYVSQGYTQTLQDTTLSTRVSSTVDVSLTGGIKELTTVSGTAKVALSSQVTGNVTVDTTATGLNYTIDPFKETTSKSQWIGCCSAYTFLVRAPAGDEGLFVTGIDVYFASKDEKLGVWFEICEMSNDGNVTRNQVPLSEVWLTSDKVNVSSDATVATRINFNMPIYLMTDRQYAFIMHTVGINPNYRIWIAKIGEGNDTITGQPYTTRRLTGSFFRTNNGINWSKVPDVDLKCTFYRASFQTDVVGVVELGNEPVERLLVTKPTTVFTNYGEGIIGDDLLTLTNLTGTISVGANLRGNISGAFANVLSISGSDYQMSNTRYRIGEKVNVYSSGTDTGVSAIVSDVYSPEAILAPHTTTAKITVIELKNSNGEFKANTGFRGLQSKGYAQVLQPLNYRFSKVNFEPGYLKFNRTAVNFEMKSTSNSSPSLGSYHRIEENVDYLYDSEKAILSRTNENSLLAGSSSNMVRVSMGTNSEYVSPVLDVKRTFALFTDNLVNANTFGEEGTSGGGLFNKYISKVVTLAEGQDAEDLQVILTAYRPQDTDVNVWVKLLHREDGEFLEQKSWTQMSSGALDFYSSDSDVYDYKELVFTIPYNPQDRIKLGYANTTNGAIQAGDIISSARSGASNVSATITLVQDGVYYLNSNGFINGENVKITFANTVYKSNGYISALGQSAALVGTDANTNGIVKYTTMSGIQFQGFKYFQIKVGLSANSSIKFPKVADLRAIALQL